MAVLVHFGEPLGVSDVPRLGKCGFVLFQGDWGSESGRSRMANGERIDDGRFQSLPRRVGGRTLYPKTQLGDDSRFDGIARGQDLHL